MTDDIFAISDPLEPRPLMPSIDWQRAKTEVERDAYRLDDAIEAGITEALRATKRLLGQHDRSHRALNQALAGVYNFADRHKDRPADIIAALKRANVPLTKATLKSAYLPVIRLLMEGVDWKLQSRYAACLSYLDAKGVAPGPETATEIARRGGIEACARALAQANGTAKPPSAKAVDLDRFKAAQPAVVIEGPLADLVPSEPGIGVLIVERRSGGDLVAYVHVGDAAAVARAIKSAGK